MCLGEKTLHHTESVDKSLVGRPGSVVYMSVNFITYLNKVDIVISKFILFLLRLLFFLEELIVNFKELRVRGLLTSLQKGNEAEGQQDHYL